VDVLIWCIAIVLATTLGTYGLGVARANRLRESGGASLNSLPSYHGMLSASFALLSGITVTLAVSAIPALPIWVAPLVAAASSGAAALYALQRITPSFRARRSFESIILGVLLASSIVAILTTVGIFASVAFESFAFFKAVSPLEFLFGSKWTPTGSPPRFGFLPLLGGTLLITTIAIAVATPLGLLSAIYMAEYASPRLRQILKPLLEMLAGIPTVVLGFFAALTMAPLIRHTGENIGLDVASESALAAGLVMGMMIVPLISSLSDDIINAVPQSLRDGSYAMGATHSETIKRVVLPAALPGIASAIMLAISRAVGETMIVVMAAGLAANLSFNPLAAVSTITVQIATLLVGDQEFDSPKTLSAFALGIVLFFFTLALNYVALRIVKKYRQAYD
jgi:phosphate transport system permease protein